MYRIGFILLIGFILAGIGCKKDSSTTSPATNNPPAVPSCLAPADNATNQPLSVNLRWTCSDPNNDSLRYALYFGTANPCTTLVSHGLTVTSFARSGLLYNTAYYWRIVADDGYNTPVSSPTWRFSTISAPAIIALSPIVSIHGFHGDTVTVPVTATVMDSQGVAVPLTRVLFGLRKRTELQASINYAGGDTTDANGRIFANLTVVVDTTEAITVTATCAVNSQVQGSTACRISLLTNQVRNVTLQFNKTSLSYQSGSADTAVATARVADSTGTGISGLNVDLRVDSALISGVWSTGTSQVTLSRSSALTDAAGDAKFQVWNTATANCDTVYFTARIHNQATPVARGYLLSVRPR